MFPKVSLTQVRGVTLPLFPLPVIGINSKETSAGARSFTLMHELVHVAKLMGTRKSRRNGSAAQNRAGKN